jgi:dihydropyrimidinase
VAEYDVVVRNGRLVREDDVVEATLCIDGAQIADLDMTGRASGVHEIDATGCFLLPGGVDPHVHATWPYQNDVTSDTYGSSSAAAFHGGTTSIIDFAYPREGMTAPEYLRARREQAVGDAMVDFGFHTVLVPRISSDELHELIDEGSTSWKVYLTYSRRGIMCDDGTLARVLEAAQRLGATVCVHAENGGVADARELALVARGDTSYSAHYRCKPWWVEAEAIQRVIFLARIFGTRVQFKHLSTRRGVELVQQARSEGLEVTAETCPQYLWLTEKEATGDDGPLFLCSPPLRDDEDREALWDALASTDGVVCVGTDHCDFTRAQKLENAADFRNIPNGLPGIETRLFLLYEEGVKRRGLSMPWLASVFSTNAAKLFGLFPRKGALQPGADADVIVFDPERVWTVEPSALHMQADWSPYQGRQVTGQIRTAIRRGEIVLHDGTVAGSRGSGTYLVLPSRA